MSSRSPLILKLSFYQPSKTSQSKNKQHVDYITRAAAVQQLEPALDSAVGHMKYMDERPGSSGLFDSRGYPDRNEIKDELGKHQGIAWRMIVSLRGDEAARVDMSQRREWETKIRACLPDVAEKMGIPLSNLRWVGAFHGNTDNPHVHLVIWEKQPIRTRGELSEGERQDVRRVLLREFYPEERNQYAMRKTAERGLILEMLKGDVEGILQLREELEEQRQEVALELRMAGQGKSPITPVAPATLAYELLRRLQELANHMPRKGRVALKFMPPELKAEVEALAKWVLEQPGLKIHYRKYLQAQEELTRFHAKDERKLGEAKERAAIDLRHRIGNELLRAAKQLQTEKPIQSVEQSFRVPSNQVRADPTAAFTQSVFASLFRTIHQEKDKAEAKSEWLRRKESRQRRRKKQQTQERS